MAKQSNGANELIDQQNASNHLANERTLLAWIRTGIGIMAFGFVVVKFSLFVREIGSAIGKNLAPHQFGYSAPIGILLVATGALCLVLSVFRYIKTKKQLDSRRYHHNSVFIYLIVGLVLIMSIILIVYLLKSV